MITVFDYQTENSLSAYPFKDECSLASNSFGDSSMSLRDDAILDFQLVTTNTDLTKVELSQFKVARVVDDYTYTFVLKLYLTDTNPAYITLIATSAQLAADPLITFSAPGYTVKLLTGWGLAEYTYSFNLFFTEGAAEFLPSTILPVHPVVSSITFSNSGPSTPTVVSTIDLTTASEATLSEGTNIDLTSATGGATLAVIPGAGQGFYDPNPTYDSGEIPIKQINAVQADARGNFNIITDSCYNTEVHLGLLSGSHPAGLSIYHTCKPKCTADDIQSFAYYNNRISDGLYSLGQYANTIGGTVASGIADFNAAQEAAVNALPVPYIDVQDTVTTVKARDYYSIVVGLYDPNKAKLQLSLTATTTDPVILESVYKDDYLAESIPYTDLVIQDGVTMLQESNRVYELKPTIDATNRIITLIDPATKRNIDCRGSAVASMVLAAPAALQDVNVAFNLLTGGTAPTGAAYGFIQLNSSKPYFHVKTKRRILTVSGVSYYLYDCTVDVFSVKDVNGDYIDSGSVKTLQIDCNPGDHGYHEKLGSCTLTNNGVATPITATDAYTFNLNLVSGTSTFPNKTTAACSFVATAATTTPHALELRIVFTVGASENAQTLTID